MRNASQPSPFHAARHPSTLDFQSAAGEGSRISPAPFVEVGGLGRIGIEVARRLRQRRLPANTQPATTPRSSNHGPTIVVKLVAGQEPGALEPAKIAVAAERSAGRRVIMVLLLPLDDEGEAPDATPTQFEGLVDALIVVPEYPRIALLRCVLNTYLVAIGDPAPGGQRLPMPFDPGYFDARQFFQEARAAAIGVGADAGKNRAILATNQAIQMTGSMEIFAASSVLAVVAVGATSQTSELHDSFREIKAAMAHGAHLVFAPYVDTRLGGQVRVTLVAAASSADDVLRGEI